MGHHSIDFVECLQRIPTAYANVEERPFQGRVTNEVKMGFSPRGPLGVSHRAEAHIKGRLTRRCSAALPR